MVEALAEEAPDLDTHYGKVKFICDYSWAAGGLNGNGKAGASVVSSLLKDLIMIGSSLNKGELRMYPVE